MDREAVNRENTRLRAAVEEVRAAAAVAAATHRAATIEKDAAFRNCKAELATSAERNAALVVQLNQARSESAPSCDWPAETTTIAVAATATHPARKSDVAVELGCDLHTTAVLYQYGRGFREPSRDPDCVVAHALLRLFEVPYTVKDCVSGSVSPTGQLPMLRRLPGVSDSIVTGCRNIERYGAHSTSVEALQLGSVDQSRMDALIALVVGRCRPAALYELWCEPSSFSTVAAQTYDQLYPWPLGAILSRQVGTNLCARITLPRRAPQRRPTYHHPTFAPQSFRTDVERAAAMGRAVQHVGEWPRHNSRRSLHGCRGSVRQSRTATE